MSPVEPRWSGAEKLSHFRNLALMALKDGKLEAPERQLLLYLADRMGLEQGRIDGVLAHPERIRLVIPRDEPSRFRQLYELTEMMIIDGLLGVQEKALCVTFAMALGFDSGVLPVIAEEIVEGHRLLRSEEQIERAIRARIARPA